MIAGDIQLLVGLGNPGSNYLGTRHNIGFMALEKLANRECVKFKKKDKIHGSLAELALGERRLRLLMPDTYMNDSGRSIRAAVDWFGLNIEQLLIIVDDIDLPLGRLRLRTNGSAGGHNGLKSTIQHLGTKNFNRLRIGIGAPDCSPEEKKRRTISHVLGTFSQNEKILLQEVLDEVIVGFDLIQRLGIDQAANRINAFQAKGYPS